MRRRYRHGSSESGAYLKARCEITCAGEETDATDEEIYQALEIAQAREFVDSARTRALT